LVVFLSCIKQYFLDHHW